MATLPKDLPDEELMTADEIHEIFKEQTEENEE